MKLLAFLLCAACFFGLFGLEYFFLLRPSRTLGVTAVAFVVVYILMTKVYGGFDIGKRKSKPIVFSMALTLLLTDLVTHFLLCIMNTTVIHGGRFVYECPLLLLAVYMLQVALVIIMAYGGNDLYFKVNKPQRCLMVARRGECIEDLIKKVGRYKKQYNIQQVAWLDQPDLLTCVDHADAVFLYELSVRERTDLVEYCYQTRKDLYYSLEMSDVVAMAGERVMFDDKTMMYCPVRELRFEERIVKRLGDILVSVVGLVLTSPILLATALAIRLEDGGPVFYRQKRATYGGRVFEVYKFRSMRAQDGSIQTIARIGQRSEFIPFPHHIIRKFRIDELPQLINVLKSDMSIVGPRPEMLENVEKYTDDLPEFRYRLRAKAGLTGLAQIYGKYNTSPRDKLIMDLAYIQQYSVWLDLKLILRTALVLLTPEESTEAFEYLTHEVFNKYSSGMAKIQITPPNSPTSAPCCSAAPTTITTVSTSSTAISGPWATRRCTTPATLTTPPKRCSAARSPAAARSMCGPIRKTCPCPGFCPIGTLPAWCSGSWSRTLRMWWWPSCPPTTWPIMPPASRPGTRKPG